MQTFKAIAKQERNSTQQKKQFILPVPEAQPHRASLRTLIYPARLVIRRIVIYPGM